MWWQEIMVPAQMEKIHCKITKYLHVKLKIAFRPKRPSKICRIEISSETFISAETKTFQYFGRMLILALLNGDFCNPPNQLGLQKLPFCIA